MKKLLYILLAIITIVIIALFVVDEKYHYEKSIIINAPAEKIYQNISSTKTFNQWNPWLKIDPNMKLEYSGTQGQIGDKYCWDSKNDDAGVGCQEITELIPNKKQKTRMDFKKPFEGTSYSEIILTSENNGTKVTWTLDSELEKPMNIMKPMMDYWMGKSYGEGLETLKALSEK